MKIKYLLYRNKNFFEFAFDFLENEKLSRQRNHKYKSQLLTIQRRDLLIKFKDVNRVNIVKLNNLFIESGYKTTYIKSLFSTLNKYIKKAILEGYLSNNPIAGYKILKGEKSCPVRALTAKELNRIENTEFKTLSKQFAADLLIFQCHTGLSYSDLSPLKYSEIESDNGKWIKGNREKNGNEYLIPIDSTSLKIIKKYRKTISGLHFKKTDKEYVFPFIYRESYRNILKEIGKEIGLKDISLSSHKGRHTFATLMLQRGVSIESIKKMLGHAQSSPVTWLYAEINKEKIKKDVFKRN